MDCTANAERRRDGFVVIPAITLREMTLLIKIQDYELDDTEESRSKRDMIERIMSSLSTYVGRNLR